MTKLMLNSACNVVDYALQAIFILVKIMANVTTAWIVEQINSGKAYRFYLTPQWEHLRDRKKAMEHNECERCRARGKYSPCEAVHHKLYLKARPDLALDINNLECLCRECHYQEHHKNFKKEIPKEFEERW